MRIPTLHDEGTDDESPAFPSATIPPVNVTFGEAITFAGSDRPEMMTAWMLEAPVGATGGVAIVPGSRATRKQFHLPGKPDHRKLTGY